MQQTSWTRRAVFSILAAAVGCYYLWGVRAAGHEFHWSYNLPGYYDYLGRAFAHGQLHVPIEPSPKLLALPNPWDPAVDDSLKMQDMALFHGRYYLYHGAGPALILFAPWRLATGHDLPENFALFLLCFGGFLFSCGALLRLLDLAGARPGPLLLGVMLLALGVCQSVPYLLNRAFVYEIAIGGGYFCISGGVFFLARGMESRRSAYWLAASGLMFGLAIACRPHLGVAGAMGLAALTISLVRSRSFSSAVVSPQFIAFLVPFALAGAAVAEYNYLRFGNPFEFGVRYLLAGADQNRIKPDLRYVLPGLYFNLFCPPDFSPVFPWVRAVFRYPFNSPDFPFPPGYFIEETAGALYIAPFLPGALLVFSGPAYARVRPLLLAMLTSVVLVLLFLAATGFTTQRYEVDFLPLLVLVALAAYGIQIAWSEGLKRVALGAVLALAVAYSAVANLALGIAGPYNEMLKNRPNRYVRIAGWFSPIERFRPMLNPKLLVEFTAEFAAQPDGFHEPLITIGREHLVYVEHLPGKLRVISLSGASTTAQEIEKPGAKPARIRITYSPESGTLTTAIDGREILAHEIGTLITAPAEVRVGENRVDLSVSESRFTGSIREIRKKVG